MAARINEVKAAVVQKISDNWTRGLNDTVTSPYRLDIDSGKLAGRKVYVFPSEYSGNPETREGDLDDYTLVLIVAERYAGQGDPPDAWTDERVDWCEWLLNLLGNPRDPNLLADSEDPDSGLWPQVAAVTTVYDLEELSERKLFVSALTITYRE